MFQAVARRSNKVSYVLGEITAEEAELARSDDSNISTRGIYLIAVDNSNPRSPGQVLAKFTSQEAAQDLATLFRVNGLLEA